MSVLSVRACEYSTGTTTHVDWIDGTVLLTSDFSGRLRAVSGNIRSDSISH